MTGRCLKSYNADNQSCVDTGFAYNLLCNFANSLMSVESSPLSYMKLIRTVLFLSILCASSAISAQSGSIAPSDSISPLDSADYRLPTLTTDPVIDSIIALGKTLLYKPYRYRGSLPWQMDCSGYLKYIYGEFGFKLPHSSSAIGLVVREIDIREVRKGDFLFFKGRSTSSPYIGHVAMVIDVNEDGSLLMMHSTVRRGIIIEKYPSDYYYVPRFVKAGRLPALETGTNAVLPVSR
jgi:cell wall-associated NlpC family hydrolase